MGVPHITSFCWCMDLEMGSRFIGYLHLVFSIALLVISTMFAIHTGSYVGTVEDAEDHLYSAWHAIAVVIAVVTVVHVILAATLVYSVFKHQTTGLRAWVYVMVALYWAAALYVVGSAIRSGFSATGSDIFLAFVEGVLFFGIVGYCIICVNSFYLMLKSCEDMEGPHKCTSDY